MATIIKMRDLLNREKLLLNEASTSESYQQMRNLLKNGLCFDILFGMADLAEKNYGILQLTSLHHHLKWFQNRASSH